MANISASKLFIVNSLSSVVTLLIQITALVWVNQFLIRNIPTDEYALYPVILSIMVVGELFAQTFTGGIGRFFVEKDALNDTTGLTQITSSMIPFLALAAVFLALTGGLCVLYVQPLLSVDTNYVADARLMLSLLILNLILNIVCSPFTQGLFVKQRFVVLNLITLFTESLRIAAMLYLLFLVSTSVKWMVVATTISVVTGLSIKIYFTRKILPDVCFRKALVSKDVAIKLIKFGSWTSSGGIATLIQKTGPYLLLSHLSTSLQLTMYNIGALVDINMRKIVQAAVAPLQPALTKKHSLEGLSALTELYYRGGKYHLWLLMIIAPPLIVFRYEIIELYVGHRFLAAGDVMMYLLLMYPFNYAGAMFYRLAHACGVIGEYSRIELLNSFVYFGAMAFAVVAFNSGGVGIALAGFITAVLMNILFFWPKGLRLIKGNFPDFIKKTMIPGCTPFLSGVAACYLMRLVLIPSTWLHILFFIAASCCVYIGTLYLFCTNTQDKQLVHNGIKKIIGIRGRQA